MRALLPLMLAASLGAQSKPVELIPKPAPKTWAVSGATHVKPAKTFPNGVLMQLRNNDPGAWCFARVISERIPIVAKFGDEPRARLTVTARQSAQIQNGLGTCMWEVKDYDRGARLGVYAGSTKDELVSFSVQIPDQSPYPPVTAVQILWHPNISPQGNWRIAEISAHRTYGPSVRVIADPNKLDVRVERSNYGGYAFGVVGSFTRFGSRISLPGFAGPGLLISPDVVIQLPLQPVITHDVSLIRALRRIHWQALEVFPRPALGWPQSG